MTAALADMDDGELLVAAGAYADAIRDAEAGLLRVAYQWAVNHPPERLDPVQSLLPGREKARRFGGEGMPLVCEFAAAELGARIGRTTYAAGVLMGDALDIAHRLPALQARVDAGEVRVSYVRHVAKQTRGLTPEQAGYVDAAVAEAADGRIPWTRFETLVEAKIAQADPELARAKEEKAAKATFAKKLRTDAHGMATFMVRADQDTRRVHAILLAVNPGATNDTPTGDLLPTATIYLHQYLGADAGPVARLEEHGPVTEAWITRVLGPRAKIKIQPVLDLAGQAPVDAYEIPDRHRQAVHLMTPADTFPYSSSLSRTMQVDHTIPFDSSGKSEIGNYGPMTLLHHRIKTHGRFQVQQPFPGIYIWRDPHGGYTLVDHTGTRSLPGTPTPGPTTTAEIYRPIPDLDIDFAA